MKESDEALKPLMLSFWVLEYGNKAVQLFVQGRADSVATDPLRALKFGSREAALDFKKSEPGLKFYDAKEYLYSEEELLALESPKGRGGNS